MYDSFYFQLKNGIYFIIPNLLTKFANEILKIFMGVLLGVLIKLVLEVFLQFFGVDNVIGIQFILENLEDNIFVAINHLR